VNIFASALLHPHPSKCQDFPGPKSFSSTFQVLDILQKNPGLFRRRGNSVRRKDLQFCIMELPIRPNC